MFQQSGGPWARLLIPGSSLVVIARLDRAIQYSGAQIGFHNGRHGVLDAPPSRGMTVSHHRSANASLALCPANPQKANSLPETE
jgi:hypothetical protein